MTKDKAVEKGLNWFNLNTLRWFPETIEYDVELIEGVEKALQITAKEKEKEMMSLFGDKLNISGIMEIQIALQKEISQLKKENEELKRKVKDINWKDSRFKTLTRKQTIKEVIEIINKSIDEMFKHRIKPTIRRALFSFINKKLNEMMVFQNQEQVKEKGVLALETSKKLTNYKPINEMIR